MSKEKVPYVQTEKGRSVLVSYRTNFNAHETPDCIEDELKLILQDPKDFTNIFQTVTGQCSRFFVEDSMRCRKGFLFNVSIDTVDAQTCDATRKYENAGFQARKRIGYHAFTDIPDKRYTEGSIKSLTSPQGRETTSFDKRYEYEGELSSLAEGLSSISKQHPALAALANIRDEEERVQMASMTSRLTYMTGHILFREQSQKFLDDVIIVISEVCHDHNLFLTPDLKKVVHEDFEFEMEAKLILSRPGIVLNRDEVIAAIDRSLAETKDLLLDNYPNSLSQSSGSKMQRGLNGVDQYYKDQVGYRGADLDPRDIALAKGIKPTKKLLGDPSLKEHAKNLFLPKQMAPSEDIIKKQNVAGLNDTVKTRLTKEYDVKGIHAHV